MTRKRKLRQRVECEDLELEHLASGLSPLAVLQPSAIADPDHARGLRLGYVIDADEAGHLDAGADLLSALANRSVQRALVVVDEATRQAPQAESGLDPAPSEENTARGLHDHGGHDFRVVPEDEVVVGTGFVHPALDLSRHERRAAVDAEVGHPHKARGKRRLITGVGGVVGRSPSPPTNLPNLVSVCHFHHRQVHEGGWKVVKVGREVQFVPPDRQVFKLARGPGVGRAA